jgi:DNA-binding NarL/FixJ family response regulator
MEGKGSGRVRVLVIDDHELVSSALCACMAADARTEIVGTAATIREGIERAAATRPEVILTDRRLPDGDMDQRLPDLLRVSPSSRVVLMTGWPTQRSSLAALDAGAHGIVCKSQPIAQIQDAIARVVAGELVLPAPLARALLQRNGGSGAPREQLSPRELDVLEGLACGETTREIGQRLCISHNTVRNHLAKAMLKLKAHDRLGAVASAVQLGLVAPRLPATGHLVDRAAGW